MPAITFGFVILLLVSLVFLLRVLVALIEEPQISQARVWKDPLINPQASPAARAASCACAIAALTKVEGSPIQAASPR
ncbi:MAG TPA: hypothetical protein VLW84_06505 [Terriglobales bacterium]|nr:hypothetical protein [Terriglobales bacterium]